MKIQNWKFLDVNLKKWGLGTKNTKTNLKYLKIKVFWAFLVKNQKLEIFK